MEKRPVLITLVGPTCSGKTTILSALKPLYVEPIITSTTRMPRHNEVYGQDYYFISHDRSEEMQMNDEYAEFTEINGNIYGVTFDELNNKLGKSNICAIVVDPKGVKKYEEICKQRNYLIYKVYVHTDLNIRIARLQRRLLDEMKTSDPSRDASLIDYYSKRLVAMLTSERSWFSENHWSQLVFGNEDAKETASMILRKSLVLQRKFQEYDMRPIKT